ncbi:MAG: helix-turn-helix transcriptional regulator [Bacteroidales bacterium]|nr:helix-turn-helix transcriptional regulator [Bacteroidales bacterium]
MKTKEKPLITHTLDEITDKHIGKRGTPKREAFESELSIELLGEAIRQARKERNLTQEELGQLVGVKKAQISKLENSLTDARFETILKVFKALNAKIIFNVELLNQTVKLA